MKRVLSVAALLALAAGCGGSSDSGGGGGGNQAPTADFSWTYTDSNNNGKIDIGEAVDFTDASTDPDGTITAWSWTFTDGTPASSADQNPSGVTFSSSGFKNVTLTVTDDGGLQASVTKSVSINDPSDTTPPDLDVTSVKLKGTATDNVAVSTITAQDGSSNDVLGTTSGLGTANATWETTDIPLGSTSNPGTGNVSVTVTATDSSSNSGSITVDVTESP